MIEYGGPGWAGSPREDPCIPKQGRWIGNHCHRGERGQISHYGGIVGGVGDTGVLQ